MLISVCVSPSALAATFRVGTGSGCTHSSLQSAINAAAARGGEDVIQVSMGALGHGQLLSIAGQDLTIQGGFEDCGDTQVEVGDHTMVSGRFGARGSVFTIRGPGVVSLENLDIVEGDPTGDGGGIHYRSADIASSVNVLQLRNVVFQYNHAGVSGGGLVATSSAVARAEVILLENVAFLDNNASAEGGAMFLSGDTMLEAQGPGLYFHRNHADTGGAVFVAQPARADIGSQDGDFPVFLMNYARVQGAAVAVVGAPDYSPSASVVRLFGTDAAAPMTIKENQAALRGGAFFVAGHPQSVFLCANQVAADGNRAPDGAFAWVDGGSLWYPGPAGCAGPLPFKAALTCTADKPCNRVESHLALVDDASLTGVGALIAVGPNGDARLDNLLIADNQFAESLLRVEGAAGRPASASIRQSVIMRNYRMRMSSGALIQQRSHAFVNIDFSTFMSNATRSGFALSLASQQTVDGLSPMLRLDGDILADDPAEVSFRVDSLDVAPPRWAVSHILARDVPAQFAGVDSVLEGEPGFIGGTWGRLGPMSPAVDFAPASSFTPAALDLDGKPRRVDLATVRNLFGPIDLGPYELQRDDRFLFRDSFEDPLP